MKITRSQLKQLIKEELARKVGVPTASMEEKAMRPSVVSRGRPTSSDDRSPMKAAYALLMKVKFLVTTTIVNPSKRDETKS